MQRFYETSWQNIRFTGIAPLSRTTLAGSEFYNNFYTRLFETYSGYNSLDKEWLLKKQEVAEWLALQTDNGELVLSIGCGLGYMESYLYQTHQQRMELHVTDYASLCMKWLMEVLPGERIHFDLDALVSSDKKFELIYLSAVDYALPDEEMIGLLQKTRKCLKDSGTCIMISASFLPQLSPLKKLLSASKSGIRKLMEAFGLLKQAEAQFWGWKRNRTEYLQLMRKAGFENIEDGFITTNRQQTYFVKGRK